MKRFIILFFCAIVLSSSILASDAKQIRTTKFFNTEIPRKMPVLVRTYPVYQGSDTFRVYFLIEIQYDFLQFVHTGNGYKAAAEFEINIKNTKTNQFQADIFEAQFKESDYRTTNSKDQFHFALDSMDVGPGSYEIIIKYRDLNGDGNKQSITFNISLKPTDQFYASPVVFTYPDKKIAVGSFDVQPSALREYWDFNRNLGIQLNTWQAQADNSVQAQIDIIDLKNEKSVFTLDTALTGTTANKSFNITIPGKLFNEREYEVKLNYASAGDTVEDKFPLKIIWFEKPFSLWNLDMAMGPVQYLMDNEDKFNNFSDGSDEERWQKLQDFWQKRDPTPETPFNELQYEFYSRVDSANIKYSRRRLPGWRSEIGKIYILYGSPDEVIDNSLAPIDKPFLRWIYNFKDRRMSFTFLALDGRKRYKLANVEEDPIK